MASASGGRVLTHNIYSILDNAADFPPIDRKRKSLCFENVPTTVGKYITIEHADPSKSLNTYSVFEIRKALDSICLNFASIQRLRNGTMLIQTKNKNQTDSLMKAKTFGGLAEVIIKEHPTLNQSIGTIYCPDIMNESEETITNELRKQGVVHTRRILKRNTEGKHSNTNTYRY